MSRSGIVWSNYEVTCCNIKKYIHFTLYSQLCHDSTQTYRTQPIFKTYQIRIGAKRQDLRATATNSVMLIHPRQREGQESRGDVIKNVSLSTQHIGETQEDIDRLHRTKVLVCRPKYSFED